MTPAYREVLVVPHWRREVGDIVETVRDAAAPNAPLRVFAGTVAPIVRSVAGRRPFAVLLSDAQMPAAARVCLRLVGRSAPRYRLWWNGSDEVLEHQRKHGGQETAICFFRDVSEELLRHGIPNVRVPYAFSPPKPALRPTLDRIGYTGEVDITDACFEPLAMSEPDLAGLSSLTWNLAEEVAAGTMTLVAADVRLREDYGENSQTYRLSLWAVRNRVRFLLVKGIVRAFPTAVALRGSDWREAGFDSERTNFNRSVRLRDYQTHRVSLDLGSKSTHATLYPRTADIVSVGGSIAQFDAGEATDVETRAIARRQVRSLDAMCELVERLLTADAEELVRENEAIQAEYVAARLDAGRSLIAAFTEGIVDSD